MKFQQLNILAIGLLSILMPAAFYGYLSPWWTAVLALCYLTVMLWGIFDIDSQFFMPTVSKGVRGKVAFTFDDGPHSEFTPKILDILKKEGVKAGFFCIGKEAEKHPDLVKRAFDEGHVIGNHSYSHDYPLVTAKILEQLQKADAVISRIIGQQPAYFRPPFGVIHPNIVKALRHVDCTIIGWDLRSRDTVARSETAIVKRVTAHLTSSTLLLFHDTNPHTVNALQHIIRLCRENGMEIVSLPELTGIEPYHA